METKLTPIKRYRIAKVVKEYPKPERHPLGAWVKYEDVSQLLQQRDELMEALKGLIDSINPHNYPSRHWTPDVTNIGSKTMPSDESILKALQTIQKHQI